MAKSNKWAPRQPLELSSANLLPRVTVAHHTAVGVHAVWVAIAFVSVFVHGVRGPNEAGVYVVLWLTGHLSLQYFIQRMRGNRAYMPGPVSVDNQESPFQLRVLGDLIVLLWFLISLAVAVLGLPLISEMADAVRH